MESGREASSRTGSDVKSKAVAADKSQPMKRRRDIRSIFFRIIIKSFPRISEFILPPEAFLYAAHFYEAEERDNLQAISFRWFLLFKAYDIIIRYKFARIEEGVLQNG